MRTPYLITLTILVLSSGLMSGCSNLPSLWGRQPADKTEAAAVVEAPGAEQAGLRQFSRIQALSPQQLEDELAALEQLPPDVSQRMRLAVTLGFGDCSHCDRKRAVALFRQQQADDEGAAAQALAGLCLKLLKSQSQNEAGSKEVARQRQQVQALKQQLDELQKKLDALTSIEESLHRR
jgi:hypothetical protein